MPACCPRFDLVFNVLDYGADPTGTIDSTGAIQIAFKLAIAALSGTVYFPPGYYMVRGTIYVACDGVHGVNVLGASGSGSGISNINYLGGNGTSCFVITGMCYSHWQGIGVNLGGSGFAENQIAFDFQFDNTNPLSQVGNRMQGINVSMQAGSDADPNTVGNHIGFRFGQSTSGFSNMTGTCLYDCYVTGEGAIFGSIGCQIGGSQVMPTLCSGCQFTALGAAWLGGPIGSLVGPTGMTDLTIIPLDNGLLFPSSGTVSIYGGKNICTYTGKGSSRTVNDGVLNGTTTLTSDSASFTSNDVGAQLSGNGIPSGTLIFSVTSSTMAVMSQAATITADPVSITINSPNFLTGVQDATQLWAAGFTVNQSVPGQGIYTNTNSLTFVGCGGGQNRWHFLNVPIGAILGGRYEGGSPYQNECFLQAGYAVSGISATIPIIGVTLEGFSVPTPPSPPPPPPPSAPYGTFILNGDTMLRLIGCNLISSPAGLWVSTLIVSNSGASGPYGSVSIEDCYVRAPLADPFVGFWTLPSSWPVNLRNVQFAGLDGVITGVVEQMQIGSTQMGSGTTLVGFFGATPVPQQSITGALSQVTDANAKAVLTSIIDALANPKSGEGYGLVADNTT